MEDYLLRDLDWEELKMKKLLLSLLCLGMCMGVVGCSNNEENNKNNKQQASKEEKKTIQLSNKNWYCEKYEGNIITHFTVSFVNPNEHYQINNIDYKITLLDNDGNVIDTSKTNLAANIYPKEKYTTGGIFYTSKKPSEVIYEITNEDTVNFHEPDDSYKQNNYKLSKINKITNDESLSITGFVKNNTANKVTLAVAVLFYKDNKLVEVCNQLLEDVKPDKDTSFSINCYQLSTEYDKYEVKAYKIDW